MIRYFSDLLYSKLWTWKTRKNPVFLSKFNNDTARLWIKELTIFSLFFNYILLCDIIK